MSSSNFNLPSDWLKRLRRVYPALEKKVEVERKLDEIAESFQDPKALVGLYVEPECQSINPADRDEDEEFDNVPREAIFSKFCGFFNGRSTARLGKNQYFVLSDAGMGKTSLLVMLQLLYYGGFWPQGYTFSLKRLGNDTLSSVKEIESPRSTILLLDALDEDPCAWGRINERLEELLKATQKFFRVIFTCRTQYFPARNELENKQVGRIVIGAYQCPMIYLSLFSQKQVDTYLKRKFPATWLQRIIQNEDIRVSKAQGIIKSTSSLGFRPMLLAHIDDLLEAEGVIWNEFTVYEELTNAWLRREVASLNYTKASEKWEVEVLTTKQLREVCIQIAWYLHSEKRRTISQLELARIIPAKYATIPGEDFDGKAPSPQVFQYLTGAEIQQLFGEVFTYLYPSRDYLLSNVPVSFVGRIPERGDPKEQWMLELKHMNDTFEHTDGSIPLERWFVAAIELSKEHLFLSEVLEQLLVIVQKRHQIEKQRLYRAEKESAVLFNIQRIKTGSLSMLNRQADGSFRFSHHSLREFFVVYGALNGQKSLEAQSIRWNKVMLDFARGQFERLSSLWHERGKSSTTKNFLSQCIALLKVPWEDNDGQLHQVIRSYLGDVREEGAELNGVDLSGLDFSGVNLAKANLRGAVLRRTNLSKANLKNADLFSADLTGANLEGANLAKANLEWGNLSEAIVNEASLSGANLRNISSKRTLFNDAEFFGSDLTGANLEGASLKNADFNGAILCEAILRGSNFEGATIKGSDFRNADLSLALLSPGSLDEAITDHTTRLPRTA